MRKLPGAIIIFVFILCVSSAAFSGQIVAIVNDEAITQKDLGDFINFMKIQLSDQLTPQEVEQRLSQMRLDLLERLIEDRLILQAARRQGIAVSEARISARIEQIKKRYPGPAEFEAALGLQGLSLLDIQSRIKEQILMFDIIDRKVRSKISVTPQEVTAYYFKQRQEFEAPELRKARFATTSAAEVIQRLSQPGTDYQNLDELAADLSLELTDLGWVAFGQLQEEIARVVFNLEIGEVSPPVYLNAAYYIFEVVALRPAESMELVKVQHEIRDVLFERKMQAALKEWLDELRSESYIEVRDSI